MEKKVILVNENDMVMGSAEKMEAHEKGLLHRAFSIFVFNSRGEMLMQQRAIDKYHSGGLWTNACCSHPEPGEETAKAARKRLGEEMGFDIPVVQIFDFVYKATFDNGLTEYEFDHVFTGMYDGIIYPDKDEVQDYCYKSLHDIENAITIKQDHFTAWFKIAFPLIKDSM